MEILFLDYNELLNKDVGDDGKRPCVDLENDEVDGITPSPSQESRNFPQDSIDGALEVKGDTDNKAYPPWRKYATVAIFVFINLLNYMDRYTIAGVLIEIEENFEINNAMAGLVQTSFMIGYMLAAPIYGYLGDRYNRIIIMIFGMVMWSGSTLISSFINDPSLFPVFVLMRVILGVGEAAFSTVATPILGDLFTGAKRHAMLCVFFLAGPLGTGFGYILGSQVAEALQGWEWALRVTPGMVLLAVTLLFLFCPDPGSDNAQRTYCNDLKDLAGNKSFICVTVGFTSVSFLMGSLTFWGPTYFAYMEIVLGILETCAKDSCNYPHVSFIFGLITCFGGIAGILLSFVWAKVWKDSGRGNADPLICAIGLLFGTAFLLAAEHIGILSITAAWFFVFLGVLSLCVTWTLVGTITLYITQPGMRSSANAVMLFIVHLFGDAFSPYFVGLVADSLMVGKEDTYTNQYITQQQAMYLPFLVCALGGFGFLMASRFVEEDRAKVDRYISNPEEITNQGSSD